jgi:hypothetical protein
MVADLFGENRPPPEKRLKEPLAMDVIVLRQSAKGVLIRRRGEPEHWISQEHLIWNGMGEQRVLIEKWKAKQCGLT